MGDKREKKREAEFQINDDEALAKETMGAREEIDLTSDKFSVQEQKDIVKMILADVRTGHEAQADWLEIKKKELQHVHADKPSIIENIIKREWMSDRNLGLLPGILDIFQATLLSTCYNPDSLHFMATEANDADNRDNLSKFAKWGLGKPEANFFPEVDDFIHNRVAHGFSVFKIMWEVKYQWVEKRIPVYSKNNKRVVIGYEKEDENRRFERGVIKNIDNTDDILMPSYGKDIQELPFFIEILHLTFNDLRDLNDMGRLENFDEEDMLKRFRTGLNNMASDDMRNKKLSLMRLKEDTDNELLSNTILDLYLWHGEYKKNGKREKYQMLLEPISESMLFGKPVRKLNRSGRLPYVGGPLRRVPGMLRGDSLTMLIAPLINALNNNYNQTSDFQIVENLPWGIANLSELGLSGATQNIDPGVLLNSDAENIKDKIFFPNLSRSLAWSYQDKDFLMQMIERLTGAASYFLTTDNKQATATRDAIVHEKSETKFGLWVKRIMIDICEAVNMWLELYQDNAPVTLGERVLGEDGEKLFKNLSINDLRGRYDVNMVPDITYGSKSYEQKVAMWGLQLSQNNMWFDEYMPDQPKLAQGKSKEVELEFSKMKQGDVLNPPPEGETPLALEHFKGHMQQKEEKYNELPEEYRGNFDNHLFATQLNMMAFLEKKRNEQIANQVAMDAAKTLKQAGTPAREEGGQPMGGQPMGGQMGQPPTMDGRPDIAPPQPAPDMEMGV